MRSFLMLLPLLLVSATAMPDPIILRPPTSAVELRTYGFGFIPFDGKFTRFKGLMHYDPSDTDRCDVMLQIEAASLAMASEAMRDKILGAGMMDAAQYPELGFRGVCRGNQAVGELTMHGQTHPVSLEYSHAHGTVVASGELRRAEWGIVGSPLIGGSLIRIRVVLPDPFAAQRN